MFDTIKQLETFSIRRWGWGRYGSAQGGSLSPPNIPVDKKGYLILKIDLYNLQNKGCLYKYININHNPLKDIK